MNTISPKLSFVVSFVQFRRQNCCNLRSFLGLKYGLKLLLCVKYFIYVLIFGLLRVILPSSDTNVRTVWALGICDIVNLPMEIRRRNFFIQMNAAVKNHGKCPWAFVFKGWVTSIGNIQLGKAICQMLQGRHRNQRGIQL